MHPSWPTSWQRLLSVLHHPSARMALVLGILLAMVFSASTVYLARQQTVAEYQEYANNLADYAVQRTERVREYTLRVLQTLHDNHSPDPCGADNITLMRRLSYGSDLIEDVGYVQGDTLLCSSIGHLGEGVAVGPVDVASPSGAQLRLRVQLPFSQDARYLLSTVRGYTVIIRADWSQDVQGWLPDAQAAVGVFHPEVGKPLFAYGEPDAALLQRLLSSAPAQAARVAHDSIVAVRPTAFGYAGFATIALSELEARWHTRALQMLPVGLAIGALLSALVWGVARRQTSLPWLIRSGLRHGEMFMLYQPVVELATGRWVGLEALVRWRRPDGSLVAPDVFIPVAERSGLITSLTRWVVGQVLRDARVLLVAHPHWHISVNFSAEDVRDATFVPYLQEQLRAHGVAAHQLVGEVTERVCMDATLARERLQALRRLGLPIAIDDFGTGYSSLAYLTQLPLDLLKIDKAFVAPIGTEAATSQVIEHIISMAQSLGLRMVAEGVETAEQAQWLQARGVQLAQGWLFAKPMTIAQVEQQLRAQQQKR